MIRTSFPRSHSQKPADTGLRQAQRMERMALMAAQVQAQAKPGVTMAGATSGRSIEKPQPCRPGKRAPTVLERQWMARITAFGCIACYLDGNPGRRGAVHHLLRGGRRIGHLHSICLCDPGHHQGGQPQGMVSRHPWKQRFEARYGTEAVLLERTKALIGWTP